METVAVETAQHLVMYLFSLVDDEELLALTVSALNSVTERNCHSVLPGLSSSRVRLMEEVQKRLKTISDEVGIYVLSAVVAFKALLLLSSP